MGLEAKLNGDGFFVTKIEAIINWARKNSVYPMPMGISCCAIEMMASADPKYDIARFGSEVMRFTPRQCDLMIVAGTVTSVSYTHLRAHETVLDLVCRLLLEKKK